MTYIYFIVEIIIFLLFFYSKDKGKQHEEYGMIMACCLWAMVFGLRAYCVGNDTPNYAAFFENRGTPYLGYGTVDRPGSTMEWGFVLVSRILHYISNSATFLFTSIAFSLFGCVYYIYAKECRANMVWSFLLLNIIGVTFLSLIPMVRQTMSICLLLLSLFFFYRFYDDKIKYFNFFSNINFWIFAGLFFLAIFTHRSSIMMFGILLLSSILKNTRTISYIIIIVAFLVSTFWGSIISETMETVLSNVSGFEDDNVSILGSRYEDTINDTHGISLIRKLSFMIPIFVTIRYTDEKEINTFFFKNLITAFTVLFLFSTSYMMNRLSVVFLVLGMCKFVPASAMTKGSKLFYFYILVTIYYLWRAFVAYGKWPITDSTLPYYFFWQQ